MKKPFKTEKINFYLLDPRVRDNLFEINNNKNYDNQ